MLIGICGTSFSGKSEVARYLELQGFRRLHIQTPGPYLLNGASTDNSSNNDRDLVRKRARHSLTSSTTVQVDKTLFNEGKKRKKRENGFEDVFVDSSVPSSGSEPVKGKFENFDSVEELVNYVTPRWTENFVTTNIHDVQTLDVLSTRPFFLLLAVQAPIMSRYERATRSIPEAQRVSVEEFTQKSDRDLYTGPNALAPLIYRAKLQILNATQSVELLFLKLSNLNLCDESRLRPSWDAYFMELANLAARRSNCMKRRVGCVLVKEKRVIATGYNGTPRGVTNCNEGGCSRCNSGGSDGTNLGACLCLHAEENALLESGRERVGSDSVLYCNTCPCLTCSIKIVQMGLKEVVYSKSYSMDQKAFAVLKEGGVTLRQYWPPEEGVVVF